MSEYWLHSYASERPAIWTSMQDMATSNRQDLLRDTGLLLIGWSVYLSEARHGQDGRRRRLVHQCPIVVQQACPWLNDLASVRGPLEDAFLIVRVRAR